MNVKGYSPYCGNPCCGKMPRTIFNGSQFSCPNCEFVTRFPEEFIKSYKERWGIK